MKWKKYWQALNLGDMYDGFICISHIITLNIVNIGFYKSFCCFSSFSADDY